STRRAARRRSVGTRRLPTCPWTRSSRWPTRWSCGPTRCRRAPEPVTRRNTMCRNIIRTLAVAAIVVLAAATAASAHAATLDQVRHATAPYRQVNVAKAAGFGLLKDAAGIHCISEPGMGAMGVHCVNGDLVGDDTVNALHPEAMVYQPIPGHQLRLVAVEYVVFKAAWAKTHTGRPHLFGQTFM